MFRMVVWEMIIGQYRVWRSSCALALSAGGLPDGSREDSVKGASRFSLINSPKSWNNFFLFFYFKKAWFIFPETEQHFTHGDAVIGHSASAALADGGRVLQDGTVTVEHVQEDLSSVAAEHVADDLRPGFPRLLKQHRATFELVNNTVNKRGTEKKRRGEWGREKGAGYLPFRRKFVKHDEGRLFTSVGEMR